jgi:hypothetical protein
MLVLGLLMLVSSCLGALDASSCMVCMVMHSVFACLLGPPLSTLAVSQSVSQSLGLDRL